jgi:transposase
MAYFVTAMHMGRSRGGLTTKLPALVDANGLPIAHKLTAGQAHDGRSAQDMLGTLGQGAILLADSACDSDAIRITMAARGAWANIKLMPNRKNRPPFSPCLYRHRNRIERFFNKLKHFRAIATRYDNFLASDQLASIRIWIRYNDALV